MAKGQGRHNPFAPGLPRLTGMYSHVSTGLHRLTARVHGGRKAAELDNLTVFFLPVVADADLPELPPEAFVMAGTPYSRPVGSDRPVLFRGNEPSLLPPPSVPEVITPSDPPAPSAPPLGNVSHPSRNLDDTPTPTGMGMGVGMESAPGRPRSDSDIARDMQAKANAGWW